MTHYYDLNNIIDIIRELECEVWEKTGGVEYFNFQVTTNGSVTEIQFVGICLWNSEIEDREFNETTDSYEPMEPFLRKRLNEELQKLSVLKF